MSRGISKTTPSFPRKRDSRVIPGAAFSMDSRLRADDVGAEHGTCTQGLAVSE